jgi:hypothetical protein
MDEGAVLMIFQVEVVYFLCANLNLVIQFFLNVYYVNWLINIYLFYQLRL